MSTEADPIEGNWYQHLDKGQQFRVIAVDGEEGVVEVQHYDGDVEEIGLDDWYNLDIEPCEAPEDWTGPVDDVAVDDLGYTETNMAAEDWTEPLAGTRRVGAAPGDEADEGEHDDWGEGYLEEEPWQEQE